MAIRINLEPKNGQIRHLTGSINQKMIMEKDRSNLVMNTLDTPEYW